MSQPPQIGLVRLILYSPINGQGTGEEGMGDESLYLDIPIQVIRLSCSRPCKYLRYLGWCVLGTPGQLMRDGSEVGDHSELVNQGIYHYVADKLEDPLARAIDPEAIERRSSIHSSDSGATHVRADFRAKLEERDLFCVFSKWRWPAGAHIIPFARGDEWFRLIVESRNAYDENRLDLNSVNDIRNGFLCNQTINYLLDTHKSAILRTPNEVLDTQDVPDERIPLPDTVSNIIEYPTHERFTFQFLEDPSKMRGLGIPNNTDAAFKKDTGLSKPSSLLLHYSYGAAAVKQWGRHTYYLASLKHRKSIPRPSVSEGNQFRGAVNPVHNRSVAIGKPEHYSAAGSTRGPTGCATGAMPGSRECGNSKVVTAGDIIVEPVDSSGAKGWDEDDWMMFLSRNTKAARERRQTKAEEFSSRINKWVAEVPNS